MNSNSFINLDAKSFEEKTKEEHTHIIDVRTPQEYKSGHIPNSKNINISDPDFGKKIAELDKGKNYLLYCRSGGRSSAACSAMKQLGFQNIYNLSGGITAYKGELEI